MPPIDDLPGTLIIPSRDKIRDDYLRDTRIRSGANTDAGTVERADSEVFADQMVPVYFDAKKIGDYVANVNKTGDAVDRELQRNGTSRLPASGGYGFVKITASSGGGTIFAGDEIKDEVSNLRFQCTQTKTYQDGQAVPIIGIDTGPATNLEAGTKLKWSFPRPGIGPKATVIEQVDGTGLSGGRDIESDADAIRRLESLRQTPPASGNDADYQREVYKTPGVSIQQAFTYPAIRGAGTTGVTFTLRPGTPGASRVPNNAQLAAAHAYLTGLFPGNDSILMCVLIEYPVTLVFKATFAQQAASWQDAVPWPPYNASDPVKIDTSTSATEFRVRTSVTTVTPEVGKTIAVYDQANGLFRKKRILSVTTVAAGLAWDISVDTSNDSSDLTYTPIVGQYICPWSESLQSIVDPVVAYFDLTGPGEQVNSFVDPNLRQHREPRGSSSKYYNVITNRITNPLFEIPAIDAIELVSPTTPYSTPIGAPGAASYLLSLGSIVVFPQP